MNPRLRGLTLTLTVALCAAASANALYTAWADGWTVDEPGHFFWSLRLLESGIGERESYPTLRSKTPIVLPNVMLARPFAGGDPRVTRLLARLPSIGLYVALLGTVFWLARSFLPAGAAPLATIACALDPNLVAHGSLVTVDGAYALATLLTLATALAWAKRPSLTAAAALGIALGLAFTAKFTAVLLLPGVVLVVFLFPRSVLDRGWKVLGDGAVAAASACVVTCAFYLFLRVGVRFSDVHWSSPLFQHLTAAAPGLRLPLPADFLTGLDHTLAWEREPWNSVLLGRRFPRGVWYYFAVLWLVKTPLLLLFATAAGLVAGLRAGSFIRDPASSFLAANLVLALGYFSFFFHSQIGYRFVLMCVPLAYLLAAAAWAPLRGRPFLARAGLAVVAVSLAENLLYAGNPLAFTNALVWPKRQAFRIVADSNIDWDQNKDHVQEWLSEAGGNVHYEPAHLLPGVNAFRLNTVAGVFDFDRHRWLREHLDPFRHRGHTLLFFEVTPADFERFVDAERRRRPPADGEALCAPLSGPGPPLTPESGGEPLSVPAAGLAIACLDAPSGADLVVEGSEGAAFIGPCGERTRLDALSPRWAYWYRLEPGLHAFCVHPVPRVSPLAARWESRRGRVMVKLRPATPGENRALGFTPGTADGTAEPAREPFR